MALKPNDIYQLGVENPHEATYAYPTRIRDWEGVYDREVNPETVLDSWRDATRLALYMHIPFCDAMCTFCKFPVVIGGMDEKEAYVKAVLDELRMYKNVLENAELTGFDLGGGTPTTLSLDQIQRLVSETNTLLPHLAEVPIKSVEATPKTAKNGLDKLHLLRRLGFNRVSMGVQTVNDAILASIQRGDNGANVVQAGVRNAREAGFEGINVDLVYGLPGQRLNDWEATVRFATELGVDHVSVFHMIYSLTSMDAKGKSIEAAQYAKFYKAGDRILRAEGYRAEVGGHMYTRRTTPTSIVEAVNSSYIRGRVQEGLPYLGIGAGAQSIHPHGMTFNKVHRDVKLGAYMEDVAGGKFPIRNLYDLPKPELFAKCILLSLYQGVVDLRRMSKELGADLEAHFDEVLTFMCEEGLGTVSEGVLHLTEKGIENISGVLALFHSPRSQEILAA